MDTAREQQVRTLNAMNAAIGRAASLGISSQAVAVAEKALQFAESNFGAQSPTAAVQLHLLGKMRDHAGDRGGARTVFERARDLRIAQFGPEHPAVASVLYELAMLCTSSSERAEGIKLLQRVVAIREARLSAEHKLTAAARSALQAFESPGGSDAPDPEALDLHNRGLEHAHRGQLPEAVSLLGQAIERNILVKGHAHPHTAKCHQTLGDVFLEARDIERAGEHLGQARQISAETSCPSDLVGAICSGLARVEHRRGHFDEARRLHEEAIGVFESLGDSDPDGLITALNNAATFEHDLGNLRAVESYYQRALTLLDKAPSEKADVTRARILNGLAITAQDRGDMSEALRLMETSVEIKRSRLGEDDPSYLLGATNLAAMYESVEDHTAARTWNERSLEALRRRGNEPAHLYRKVLLTSADLARDRGDLDEARKIYKTLIASASGTEQFDETLTRAVQSLADLEKPSIDSLEELVRRQKATVGTAHPRYARALEALATELLQDPSHAKKLEGLDLLREAWAVIAQTEHMPLSRAVHLHRLIISEWRNGFAEQALARLPALCALLKEVTLDEAFSAGTLEDLLSRVVDSTLSLCISAFLAFPDGPLSIEDVLGCMLFRKAFLLESARAARVRLLKANYPSVERMRGEIAAEVWRLTDTLFEGLTRPAGQLDGIIAATTAKVGRLTREAYQGTSVEPLIRNTTTAPYRSLVQHLQRDEALVEIVKFDRWEPASADTSAANYIAFITAGTAPEPRYVVLGSAEEVEGWGSLLLAEIELEVVGERSASNTSRPSPAVEQKIQELFSLVPTGCVRLYAAPDALFWQIPLEALQSKKGDFYVESYEMVYVSSIGDLYPDAATSVSPNRSVVICDPDFDLRRSVAPDDCWSTLAPEKLDTDSPFAGVTITYSETPKDATDLGFNRLPGTRAEGERVTTLLKADLLCDKDATKQTVLRLQSPQVLHIATHGFALEGEDDLIRLWSDRLNSGRLRHVGRGMHFVNYLSGRMEHSLRRLAGDSTESQRRTWPHLEDALDDSLFRCGIVLAGANTWLSNEPTTEHAGNGFVTARELAFMDLRETELVVLSTCKSGVGHSEISRGVEGLRRAFLLAGADSVLVTLWEIPDRETQEFMDYFYRGLLRGQSKAQALREAKLEHKKRWPQRYHWAGFVLQGDPRPLVERATD